MFRHHLSGRLGKGVFWNLVGTVFTQGSVFIAAIVMARILGKEAFGEFGMVQSTLLTLTTIAQVATGITATKYVAEFRDVDKERAGRILGLCSTLTLATGIVATVLLLIGAPLLAESIFGAPHLATSLSIAAAFVFFSVMNGYQIGALAGLESFKSIAVYGVALGATHIVLCGLGAKLWGLHGALGGLAVSAFLRWTVYSFALHRESAKRNILVRRKEGFREQEILYKFALPAALSGLTTMPSLWLGNAFLVQQPNGFSEMGLYSAGINLRTLVLFLPVVFNNVAVSLINSHRGQKNRDSYQSSVIVNLKVTFVLALIGTLVMWLAGEWALQIFGSDFVGDNVRLMISIMALSVVIEAVGIAVYQVIQSHEKMWSSFFIIALPRDLVFVIAAYFLSQQFGGAGLAAAFALSCLLALIVKIWLAYKMDLHKKV